MEGATWIGLGTLVTAIVGITLVGWQLHEQRRGMRAEFGNIYIQRYWEIDDALLREAKGSDPHKQARHRYLRLFEDEFDVARLGFLDRKQWSVWHEILDDKSALALVQDDLLVCDPREKRFRRLRACVEQRDRADVGHSVKDCSGRLAPIPSAADVRGGMA